MHWDLPLKKALLELTKEDKKMAEKAYVVLIEKRREGKHAEVPRESTSRVVEDYPSKVLAEVTASQHQELLRQGYKIEDLSSKIKIRVGTLAIDPTIPEEREEAVGPADEEEAIETEYFFVQFIGPMKTEWLEQLVNANVTPLSYYHDFAYLVHSKKSDLEEIAQKAFIRATMPYVPSLRMTKDLKQEIREAEADATGRFQVVLFANSDLVKTDLESMKAMGIALESEVRGRGLYLSVLVSMPFVLLDGVAKLEGVFKIEPFVPDTDMDEVADQIVAGNYNHTTNEVDPPAAGHHPYLEWLDDTGISGNGVNIGIVEYGGRIDEDHDAFVGRINTITAQAKNYHATMVGGQAAGDYRDETDGNGFIYGLGISPGSELINQGYGDHGSPIDADGVCADTVGQGGVVQNNSWGASAASSNYQNRDAVYDRLVRNADGAGTPLSICFASGNKGDVGLGRPAGAKNLITVGSFENYRPADLYGCGENDADNINERYIRSCIHSGTGASSIGSCADGRVKPDVVAPGQWTASANFGVTAASWPNRFVSDKIVYGGGTSAASPKVAGACALLVQWWGQRHRYRTIKEIPSPALLKAMIINGAVDTGEGGPIPNVEQGWGRIHLNNVINPEIPAVYVDQGILLQLASADVEFDIEPIDIDEPMKISLVWTDSPGDAGDGTAVARALKNAFGLEVTRGADTWFGNNFAGGWSQTGGTQDAIQAVHIGIVNNVQNVFIENPITETYHIRISPESIVENCLRPDAPLTLPLQQDFTLVIQNARLTTTEPMDMMLCVDRTGSMRRDPIAAAKSAAMQFMDLIPTDNEHQAGLVSYAAPCTYPYAPPCDADASIDDRASIDSALTPVTDALKDHLTDPTGPIGSIAADDCTSIAAGLRKAAESIVENGSPLHRKTIVLLTDGKENRSPCVSDVLPLLRKEYVVHVVAYGHSINVDMVDQIATGTGGELLHAPTEDGLAAFYHELLALETDSDVVDSETDSFAASDTGTHKKSFPIVKSDSEATFILGWTHPDVSFDAELVTPNGDVITPAKALRSRNMSYVKRDTHIIYTLKRPARATDWEGEWSMKVRRAAGSAPAAETYTASVLVRTSLRLMLLWDKVKYFTKDLIRLKAQVIDKQYVLKDSVKMALHTTTPVKGYGSTLASMPKKALLRPTEDVVEGALAALDRLSEEEWQALYIKSEEVSETSFEMVSEDALERSATPIFTTPHVAKLNKLFRPLKDGISTYRVKVEGRTASGARYTRVRTVSKYIGAKVDAKISTVVLKPVKPQQPKVMQLTFTPKDLHGNLVGPGHATSIKVDVKKGALKGSLEDLLNGSYSMEIEAAERPEVMAVAVSMADVSIPVPVTVPSVIPTLPVPAAKPEGKVEQLRFDEKGNFQGFSLQTLGGSIDFASISSRLAQVLAGAMEKDLTVAITQDESTGEVTEVWFKTP